MKKIILLVVAFLFTFLLTGCVFDLTTTEETSTTTEQTTTEETITCTNDQVLTDGICVDPVDLTTRLTELQANLEDAQSSLDNAQVVFDDTKADYKMTETQSTSAQSTIDSAQALLDDAGANLIEDEAALNQVENSIDSAKTLIENLYSQLKEFTGIDVKLLYVVEKQHDAIVNMGQEVTVQNESYSNVGSGLFGQSLSGPRVRQLSSVSPFEYNEEWQDTQATYYEMLQDIVQQGYGEGTVVNFNEFTLQHPLDYYGINVQENQEHFIKINLDGSETLFSRILTYNDITLENAKVIKAKTVTAYFLDGKLQLMLAVQEFDDNEKMNSLYVEDFKEDIGIVTIAYTDEFPFYSNYQVGVNIRDNVYGVFEIVYSENDIIQRIAYTLYYVENDELANRIMLHKSLEYNIGRYNIDQYYLSNGDLTKWKIQQIISDYSLSLDHKYDRFYTYSDLYTTGEAYILGLNLDVLNPLMTLYHKLLQVDDYLTSYTELNSSQQNEFDSLVTELNNYEYNGEFYDFIDYNAETEVYTLIDALPTLPLKIVNNNGWMDIYDSYTRYKDLLNNHSRTLEESLRMMQMVAKLLPLYNYGNVDIFMPLYTDAVILRNDLPATWMASSDTIISEANISDANYLDDNIQLATDAFPAYYNANEESILSLMPVGFLYDPLDTSN